MLSEEISVVLKNTPAETNPEYFRTWQRTSVHLQKQLQPWVSRRYFQTAGRCEDLEAAYPMIVFAACRPYYGRHPADFTYDVADAATLPAAWRTIGKAMRKELALIVRGLQSAPPALARRYAPVWHKDILFAVRKKPRRLIALLACEAVLINTVIDWGTVRTVSAEKRFARAVMGAARIYEMDIEELRGKVLDELIVSVRPTQVRRGQRTSGLG
jgi:hypothetical protein